jgi:hypothetical protein
MTYYIILDGEDPNVVKYDSGILGETSGKSFYANRGFTKLNRIANEKPELLEKIHIYDDTNKEFTIEKFLNILSKHKIIK